MSRPAVATGHPETTRAAVDVLRAGGNAFDAAIAAAFASAVAEPALTSLGGGGFLMAAPSGQSPGLWDFFTDAPGRGRSHPRHLDFRPLEVDFRGSTQVFQIGLGSVAVPGCLAGYVQSHRALGRMSLADVVAPAVALARDGVVLNAAQAFVLQILGPIFTEFPDSAAIYAPGGALLAEGQALRNPDLAGFLEQLPHGAADDFYRGTLAAAMDRDMEASGGLMTRDDLAAFSVERRPPLRVGFAGTHLYLNPEPSFGGGLLAFSLRMLEETLGGAAWYSPEHLVALAAVMVEVDRQRDMSSPFDLAEGCQRVLKATRGTTHVSVADAEGNLAALNTSNGSGSGYIVPGTGIMLNNMLGEDDLLPDGAGTVPAGGRISSMMCPGVALRPDGSALAFGSGGSKRIRTALLQVLTHRLAFERPLAEAVTAPRMHWDGAYLQIEPGFPRDVLDRLASHWDTNVWESLNIYFGGVHAVDQRDEAAADPRRGGAAWVG